jgi:6 kDa early secretory antigenic target
MSISDNSLYVNYGSTGDVQDQLVQADRQISSVLDNLTDSIAPLRATWSGASDAEYTQVQNRWNSDINAMSRLMGGYSNTLDEMSRNYSTTDNGLAEDWAQIGSGMR